MTIKQFIEKAIEGGWKMNPRTFVDFKPSPWPNDTVEHVEVWISSVFLDPEAWKCAGLKEEDAVGMVHALFAGSTIEEYIKTL